MSKARKDLVDWCENVSGAIKPAELSVAATGKLPELRRSVEQQELLVPVVGAFSSGKSTLINKIIGDNVLPTAITPETSLATELRYSTDQRIEAVKEDGGVVRFDISEIKKVTDAAGDFSFARLYIDSERVKELEPLVLVDMPGFDSPLDAHNKAIMAYVDRGSHYIVLASVQEGTVTKSLLRRIREINSLGRGLSFFLTKADLKPTSEVEELVEHFTEALQDNGDFAGGVAAISQTAPDAVVKLLKSIDADGIFFDQYRGTVQDISFDLVSGVNNKIKALNKDAAGLADAVEELDGALRKLQSQAADEAESLSRRHGGGALVNEILDDVGEALEGATNELVGVAKSGDTAAAERYLIDIVRAELNMSVSNRLGKLNREIVADFSGSLSGLTKVLQDQDTGDDFIQKLTGVISPLLSNLGASSAASTVGKVLGTTVIGLGSKGAGGLAAFLNPVLGLAIAFLPEILGFVFKGSGEAQQEKLRTAFLGQVFPQIKAKLRPELQSQIDETVRGMIEQVRVQYEAKINQAKAEFEAAKSRKQIDEEEKAQVIAGLESAREAVTSLTTELLTRYA